MKYHIEVMNMVEDHNFTCLCLLDICSILVFDDLVLNAIKLTIVFNTVHQLSGNLCGKLAGIV